MLSSVKALIFGFAIDSAHKFFCFAITIFILCDFIIFLFMIVMKIVYCLLAKEFGLIFAGCLWFVIFMQLFSSIQKAIILSFYRGTMLFVFIRPVFAYFLCDTLFISVVRSLSFDFIDSFVKFTHLSNNLLLMIYFIPIIVLLSFIEEFVSDY